MVELSLEDRRILRKTLQQSSVFQHSEGRRMIIHEAGLARISMNLEGDPSIVIGNMISKLESYGQIQYKNEALGYFLHYLEEDDEHFGIEDRTFFHDLIVKYHILNSDAKQPELTDDDWKSPFDYEEEKQSILEAAFGENTLRPIAFLKDALKVARSVARVELPFDQGTGFMIGLDLLLTNHHVLESKDDACKAEFQFGYRIDSEGRMKPKEIFSANPEGIYHSNEKLDYAIVELHNSPGNTWGYLQLKSPKVVKDQRVNIIQYPAYMGQMISFQNNFVEYVDDTIVQYLTTTQPGSSGSPVFNDKWEVVALHHAGGTLKEPATNRRYARNEGMIISAILNDLLPKIQTKLSQ